MKASLKTIALSTFLGAAAPAFADHGEAYLVKACDSTGTNTAQLEVTTVNIHGHNETVQSLFDDTFSMIMSQHTAADLATITPAFKSTLVDMFTVTMPRAASVLGLDTIYIDFDHPLPENGGPVVEGCTPEAP